MVVAQEEQLLAGGDELLHPDPVVLELNRLQNQIKEKDRELGAAQAEIKALKAAEAFKDKALEELRNELQTLDEKLRANENFLGQKNLKINKLINEKKEALAAQFAAEATLRRVYADQKEDEDLPLESVIAPLESEIKMLRNEVAALQEDKKALERLTKSKEAALLEAEKILKSALDRVLIVEEVQNQNFELRRQIEICHEENKILEKSNRQKVMEVEKLSQTIKELEEAILAGGAAANTIRDYRRQISELHDEKRTLERELARVKVSANRVATVVANEWKDENDKVMPVKQWLEERRLVQAEMQKLRDKLAISERTAKAEAQLKDKFKLRIKILEEGLRQVPSLPINTPSAFCGSPGTEKSGNILGFITSNGEHKRRSTSQPRGSTIARNSIMPQPGERERAKINGDVKQASTLKTKHGSMEVMLKKCLWAPKSKLIDSSEKENKELKGNTDAEVRKISNTEEPNAETNNEGLGNEDSNTNIDDNEDMVSGFLYDRLQREVINLRKLSEVKNGSLEAKDQEIKLLMKKVDALTRAMDVESRKVKREAAAREKETGLAKTEATKSTRNMICNKRGMSTA